MPIPWLLLESSQKARDGRGRTLFGESRLMRAGSALRRTQAAAGAEAIRADAACERTASGNLGKAVEALGGQGDGHA